MTTRPNAHLTKHDPKHKRSASRLYQAVAVLLCSSLLSSCTTPEGASLAGQSASGALGAIVGGVVGHQSGRGWEGALVGGVLGAAAGKKLGAGELFKTRRLKFQEAAIRGDFYAMRRHYSPEFVNDAVKGYPLIYYATIRGHESAVRFLVYHGARRDYRFDGRSLAYHAARSGHRSVADYLVTQSAGSSSDVARGSSDYAANQARIRKQNEMMAAAALTVLSGMMGGGGSGSDDDYQTRLNKRIMENTNAADQARRAGQ